MAFLKGCSDTETNSLTRAPKGEYTVTLVYGYNEETGDYTPISNTILYHKEYDNFYSPYKDEIESIPLERDE